MEHDNGVNERRYLRRRLSSLSSSRFKEFVKELWERRGYTVEEVSTTDEKSYDLLVTEQNAPGGRYFVGIESEEETNALHINDLHKEKWGEDRRDKEPNIAGLYFVTNQPVSEGAIANVDPAIDNPKLVKLVTSSKPEEPYIIDLLDLIDDTGSKAWLEKYDLLQKSPVSEEAHRITITVVTETGTPIEDAVLTLRKGRKPLSVFDGGEYEGRTDEAGETSAVVESGQYTVTATHENFDEKTKKGITVPDETDVTLRLKKKIRTVTITTTTPAGEPVSGSRVTIRDPEGSVVEAFRGMEEGETDKAGQVKARVPHGRYTVAAHHEEFGDEATKDIRIDETSREVSLQFERRKTHRLTITVEDERGAPVEGALVTVRNESEDRSGTFDGGIEAETDHNGQTTIEVSNGRYLISATQEKPARDTNTSIEIAGTDDSVTLSFKEDNSNLNTIWRKGIKTDLVLLVVSVPLLLLNLRRQDILEPSLLPVGFLLLIWIAFPFLTSINIRKPINIASWIMFPVLLWILVNALPLLVVSILVFISWLTLPAFLYIDSKKVIDEIDWRIYRFNYIVLSVILGVNIFVAYLYLKRRKRAYERHQHA